MEEREIAARGIKFSIVREGVEAGRATLYLLRNDLHPELFGLLEDVWVGEAYRSGGIGSELLDAVITRAKAEGCYKIIATSRADGTRGAVHEWYLRHGFKHYGIEFRMDF